MDRRPGTASQRRLEDEFYRVMSKFNNRQWGEFARSKRHGLNLPEYQIDDIRSDYSNDVREQKYQMLSLWQRRNGKRASPALLEQLVNNFLNPVQVQHDSISQMNLEPATHDVGRRQRGSDSSDTLPEPMSQQSSVVADNPGRSPSLNPGSLNVHSDQSMGRAFESTQNGDPISVRRENPSMQQNGVHSLGSQYIHNDNSLPNRASSSLTSAHPSRHYSSQSTASFPQGDVGDATGYRENVTRPKALASPPTSSHRRQIEARNKPTFPHFMQNLFGGIGNVNINVIGQNAVGVQTNYYFGGRKVQKKSPRPQETSQQLAEYCSGVTEVSVVKSKAEFYDVHLERLELIYKVTHQQKGAVLIINNSFPGQQDERHGSDKDMKNLIALWDNMGCKTFIKSEQKASESIATLTKFAGLRTSYESDFVVVFIMSHGGQEGGKDVFYGSDRKSVKVQDVLTIFNNVNARKLQGIPKIFFFQFCRGNHVDMGTEAPSRTEPQEAETLLNSLENTVSQTVGLNQGNDSTDAQGIPTTRQPTISDTLISFATQAGFRAFRNSEGGSWYINAIVNIFMRHAHDQHLLDLMTMVNRAVSSRTAINEDDRTVHEGKEMSDFRSTLRKKLFFFPGFPDDSEDDDDFL